MGEIVNRKELAERRGVSLPTIDGWVRKGCPVIEKGGQGKSYSFDLDAVEVWCDRYRSSGRKVSRNGADLQFNSSQQAEIVKALGFILANVGPVAADMALKAGATIETAYAVDTLVAVRVGNLAQAYMRRHGVPYYELTERFCRIEDEIQWQAVASERGREFNETDCEGTVGEIDSREPSCPSLGNLLKRLAEG